MGLPPGGADGESMARWSGPLGRTTEQKLRRCAGTQFDAAVAEAFIAVWRASLQAAPAYGPADLTTIAA